MSEATLIQTLLHAPTEVIPDLLAAMAPMLARDSNKYAQAFLSERTLGTPNSSLTLAWFECFLFTEGLLWDRQSQPAQLSSFGKELLRHSSFLLTGDAATTGTSASIQPSDIPAATTFIEKRLSTVEPSRGLRAVAIATLRAIGILGDLVDQDPPESAYALAIATILEDLDDTDDPTDKPASPIAIGRLYALTLLWAMPHIDDELLKAKAQERCAVLLLEIWSAEGWREESGTYEMAMSLLDEALERLPPSSNHYDVLLLNKASALSAKYTHASNPSQDDLNLSIKLFENLMDRRAFAGQEHVIYLNLGPALMNRYFDSGAEFPTDAQRALDLYALAVQQLPEHSRLAAGARLNWSNGLRRLAEVGHSSGSLEEALCQIRLAIPDLAPGSQDRAGAEYNAAVMLTPDREDDYWIYSEAAIEEAIGYLEDAMTCILSSPYYEACVYKLAWCLRQRGLHNSDGRDFARARELLERLQDAMGS